MITLHHLNNSRSQRILWLLEELGVPYEIRLYQRNKNRRAPKELEEIHPLGKSPVITDDSVTLAESGAIIEYLISQYGDGKFKARTSGPGYLDNLYFIHYAEGTLMPLRIQKIVYEFMPQKTPFFIRPIASMISKTLIEMLIPALKKNLEFIENHLKKSKSGWFAGGVEPTAADFQIAYPLEAIVASMPDLATPKVVDFVKQVHSRPAYQRALQKGGAYAYA